MNISPIILFAYNRIGHLQHTLESLIKNDLAADSDLIIYSDGPKDEKAIDNVSKVRSYIRNISGFKSVRIIERKNNWGLSNSIINGVTDIIDEFGRVIVVEDDLVCSKYFIRYMNDALNYYENDEKVISVHGYVYPVNKSLPETFFIKGADCWGWGTWKRGWDIFENDSNKLSNELKKKNLTWHFDMNGAHPYTQMLENQCLGKIDSWAIRWYASAFVKDKLTLYPGRSLVHNIGNDGSGTHCGSVDDFDVLLSEKPVCVGGIDISENKEALDAIAGFLRKKTIKKFPVRLKAFVKRPYHFLVTAYQNSKQQII